MKTKMFKKMTAMIIAVMMVVSVMPIMASAATPNGDYWEELSYITFDGFTRNTSSDYGQNYTKTVNDGTDDEWTYTIDLMSAWNGSLHGYSGNWKNTDVKNTWSSFYDDAFISTWPIATSDRGFMVQRNGVTINGTWTPGRPTSQLRAFNIFDASKIKVGDKVKITTWVYPADIYTWDSTKDSPVDVTEETDDMMAGVRFWLWSDEAQYCNNAPNTNANQGFVDEAFVTPIPFYEWSEVSIEYDICNYSWQNNTEITSIRTDNAGGTYYPRNTFYAGLKAAKFVKAGGTYGIEEGTVKGSVALGIDETVTAGTHKVIVAAYNDQNMFVGCDIKDYTKGGSFDFEIENAADADSVMAFLWDISKFEPKITPLTLSLAY